MVLNFCYEKFGFSLLSTLGDPVERVRMGSIIELPWCRTKRALTCQSGRYEKK